MEKEVKSCHYYRCSECGGKEKVDKTEGYQGYGLCWDCYVIENFRLCED